MSLSPSGRAEATVLDLPEGSLLVAAAALAAFALAPAPVCLGLAVVALARAAGTRALLAGGVMALGGGVLVGLAGPQAALLSYLELAPAWRLPHAAETRGLLDLATQIAPVTLAGAGLVATGAALWLESRRPFWVEREPRRGATARLRARRERRALAREGGTPAGGRIALGLGRRGEIVELAPGELGAHALVVGATGSGKTTTLLRLLSGLVPASAGIVVVDLKGDPGLVEGVRLLAGQHGRPFDLWTLDGPQAWNPLARGEATELMNKVVALEEWSEPHYKRAAQRYLHTVLSLLLAGETPDLPRLASLLAPEALLAFLDSHVDGAIKASERERVEAYVGGLDRSSASAIQGLANRLALLTETRAGAYLAGGPEALDLARTLTGGRVTVFSLDAQRYGETAAQLAALVAEDLRTAASGRLAAQGQGRARRQAFVVFDEFSAMRSDNLVHLFARGRSAGIGVLLATQELADLTRVDPGFADQVLANTNVKLVHRQDVPESAERLAGLAGTRTVYEETFQTDRTPFVSVAGRRFGGGSGRNTGRGTIRQVEEYVVHPNELKQLGQGTAVLIRKHPVARVEIVRVAPPNALRSRLP